MSFEVDTQGLQNARVLIQMSSQNLSRTLDQRLAQAQSNLGYAMRDARAVSQVLRSISQVRENGRRLVRKMDAYDDTLRQVIRIYERTEDDVVAGARGSFLQVRHDGSDANGRRGRGLAGPSYQLFTGVDQEFKVLVDTVYATSVRQL